MTQTLIAIVVGALIGAVIGAVAGFGLGFLLFAILSGFYPPTEFSAWSAMALTFWLTIILTPIGAGCGVLLGWRMTR